MVYVADEQAMISPPRGGEAAAELDRLGDEIAELAAHLHAATYQLLVRLRVFDEQGGWGGGFRSCAHWLSWRTAIGLGRNASGTARVISRSIMTTTARMSYAAGSIRKSARCLIVHWLRRARRCTAGASRPATRARRRSRMVRRPRRPVNDERTRSA